MPQAAPLAMPGMLGGAAAGTAAAGMSAGAMAALSIGGSVLSAAASGWMQKAQIEDEREAEREAMDRRQETYRGLGEATSFRRQARERPRSKQISQPGLGQRPDMVGAPADRVGRDYTDLAERRRQGLPRYEYDPETGRIRRN